jgi:hypothetical protein
LTTLCEKHLKSVGSGTKLLQPVEKLFFSPTAVPSENPMPKPRTTVIPVIHTLYYYDERV